MALAWTGTIQAADQTVTSVADSGAGSLRQALADVAANDSVFFNISGSPATITLASGLSLGVDGVSLLAQPGGNVTVSLSGASSVITLTATSLGTIGGASALAIGANATGSQAYGIYSSGGAISIGSIAETGSVTATAGTSEAYGLRGADGVTITGEMAGNILAIAADGNAAGIVSDFGDVTIGDMGGAADHWASVIAMAGGDTAVGIGTELGSVTIASLGQSSQVMALAGGMTAFGIQAGDTLTITGDLSGIVVAAAGNMAAGLTAGTVNIGSVSQTGWILSHSAGDDAYGILAACDVSIAGGMAGTISAVADGNTAVGIMAFQELNGGDPATALAVSGTVSAQADGLAVGVASGEAMNLNVTGTLSGVDTTGGGQGYAIRAGVADGFGGWIVGSADNTVTLGTGAQLVGKVDLGTGGDNSLNLIGLGAADNLFLGVDHLTVGDGSTATSWNLSLSSANASTVDDLAVNALASLRVNENLTITGNIANDGTFISDLGANRTYGGVISGAGTLVKDGAATLTLSGANTYTGATVISGGTLRLGAADALSDRTVVSLADVDGAAFDIHGYDVTVAGLTGGGRNGGNVRLGSGTLTVANADDNLFAGVISGTGGLTKSGAATLTLSGNNTYIGDTSVTAGTLRVTGSLASASVDVAAGSLLDMSPVADTTYAGVISGAGDFVKSGAGILTLSGDSTYTGATTLASGMLRITGSLASQNIDMAAGTLLDMSPVADTTYAGVIEGAGTFLKSGDATLTLSGDSTYTGATWVTAGLLDVTGSLASPDYQIDAGAGIRFANNASIDGDAVVNGTWTSPLLTVGSTGTLMGTGTIIGDVESHGVISPGLSAGTLTIDGDLLLSSGSLLSLEITPTASDLVHVTGATTIDGGSLHVDIASGYYTSGQQFTLLASDGGLSGDYETITIDNQSSFLVFSVENTDTATVGAFGGDVTVTRLPYAIAATTRNAYGASLGLTGATSLATPAMQSILAEIDFMSLGEVAQGLKQMSPEPYSALVETSFSAMRLFSDTIRERTYAARGGGESVLAMVPGGEMSRMTELASRTIASDAPSGITATSGQAGARGLFVKPVGQYLGFDTGHNRTGFDAWQYGVVAGGDMAVSDTLLAGFQVGYVHSDLSFSDTAKSNGRSDTFLGGLYASYASGGFYADGLVQAGAAWNRLVRKIEFGSIATRPQGTYVSFLFGGSLTTGYDWSFGKLKAGPVATLDYGYVSVPGFAETGDAELGLTVRGFSGNSLKTGLGAKVSGTFTVGEKTAVSPDVSLRWGHEFLNDSQNIKARFNGSPTSSFSAKTGDPGRDSLLVDAGVSVGVSDSTKLYLRYSGQLFGQGSRSQAGAVGVRYEF